MTHRNTEHSYAKIRADEYRLQKILEQLIFIQTTTPSPKLREIATRARKAIRL